MNPCWNTSRMFSIYLLSSPLSGISFTISRVLITLARDCLSVLHFSRFWQRLLEFSSNSLSISQRFYILSINYIGVMYASRHSYYLALVVNYYHSFCFFIVYSSCSASYLIMSLALLLNFSLSISWNSSKATIYNIVDMFKDTKKEYRSISITFIKLSFNLHLFLNLKS